ncbi:MAG: hypothetical protein ACO3TI_06990 [Aquiluna sp.]
MAKSSSPKPLARRISSSPLSMRLVGLSFFGGFFAYLALTSPHSPLQVAPPVIKKFVPYFGTPEKQIARQLDSGPRQGR